MSDGIALKPPADCASMAELREQIDAIDAALVALFWIDLRRADRVLLIGALALFGTPYYVTYVSERYRFPIDAVLVLLSAWLVLRLLGRAPARERA